MADKKATKPKWNQNQLKIAKLLIDEKMEPPQVIALGFKKTSVHKIKRAIKAGYKPPSTDEAYIAAAEPAKPFEEYQFKPKGNKIKEGQKTGEVTPAPTGKEEEKGPKKIVPTVVRLSGLRIDAQYTPIMDIAKQAATEEWNWNSDMRFEDFIDTILYHFFKDRGITLQGYIVDEKVKQEVEAG